MPYRGKIAIDNVIDILKYLGTGASVGTGYYLFIKGGIYTNWTLLYQTALGSTAVYPVISSYNSISTADNIRIPTSTWLPTPLAYDTFTRADGAIGSSETTGPDSQTTPSLAWTGGAISSNKNVITPSLGSEMWDAPASRFDSGTYAWTPFGTNTVANVDNTLQMTYVDNNVGAIEIFKDADDLNSNLTVGTWYQFSVDASVNIGTASIFFQNPGTQYLPARYGVTSATPTTFTSGESIKPTKTVRKFEAIAQAPSHTIPKMID